MEASLKQTVLHLQSLNTYVHFSHMRAYNKFGCQSVFKNEAHSAIYDVLYFSRPVLQVNSLIGHFTRLLPLYRQLNTKIVSPILDIIVQQEGWFVVSRGYTHTLADLIAQRKTLTQFQIAYFLTDLVQMLSYFHSRDFLLEKLSPQDLYMTSDQKLTIGFSMFFSEVGSKPVLRNLPFRHESRNHNNCPDLFLLDSISSAVAQSVNAWNVGVQLHAMFLGRLPFKANSLDTIGRSLKGNWLADKSATLHKDYKLEISGEGASLRAPELTELIEGLLKPIAAQRIKFNLIVVHPFLKQFPSPPHILPTTIFNLPPSEQFKQEYFQKFAEKPQLESQEMDIPRKEGKMRTHMDISGMRRSGEKGQRYYKTHKEIQQSQRSLGATHCCIEEFADISDSLGYGYLMSSGMTCFVFNDETQYWFFGGSAREVRARNTGKKGSETVFFYDKLPQEEDVRKKIHILEAFAKTLKRRSKTIERQNAVGVEQYCRTNYASLFLLSNDSVQVFFNDKVIFLLSKSGIMVQLKNTDKLQPYNYSKEDRDLTVRREYCLNMAQKLFFWEMQQDQSLLEHGAGFDQQPNIL